MPDEKPIEFARRALAESGARRVSYDPPQDKESPYSFEVFSNAKTGKVVILFGHVRRPDFVIFKPVNESPSIYDHLQEALSYLNAANE